MIPLILLLAVGGMMHAVRSFTGGVSVGGIDLAFGYLLLTAYCVGRIVSRFGDLTQNRFRMLISRGQLGMSVQQRIAGTAQ